MPYISALENLIKPTHPKSVVAIRQFVGSKAQVIQSRYFAGYNKNRSIKPKQYLAGVITTRGTIFQSFFPNADVQEDADPSKLYMGAGIFDALNVEYETDGQIAMAQIEKLGTAEEVADKIEEVLDEHAKQMRDTVRYMDAYTRTLENFVHSRLHGSLSTWHNVDVTVAQDLMHMCTQKQQFENAAFLRDTLPYLKKTEEVTSQ